MSVELSSLEGIELMNLRPSFSFLLYHLFLVEIAACVLIEFSDLVSQNDPTFRATELWKNDVASGFGRKA